jgi:hypothetical protein
VTAVAVRSDPHSTFGRSIDSPPWGPSINMATRNGHVGTRPSSRSGIGRNPCPDNGGQQMSSPAVDDRNVPPSDPAFRMHYMFESRLLATRLCRAVDAGGVWESFEAIGKEVSCRPVEGVLFDIRESEYVTSTAAAHAFAAYVISFFGRRRLAFLTRSAIQYGMARIIAADGRAHRVNVSVFQDEHRAARWLCSSDKVS